MYRGDKILATGVVTDVTKTEMVSKWPQPSGVEALIYFLGLASYYRKFVANVRTLLIPF